MAKGALEQQDIEKEQVKAAIEGSADSGGILDIRKIENTLRGKLDAAGNVFTKDDKERWERKIGEAAATADKKVILEIADKIDEEKREIGKITQEFSGTIEQNKGLFGKTKEKDTAKKFVEDFLKEPVEKKRQKMEALKKDIGERLSIYAEIIRLDPAMKDQIDGLGRAEGIKKLELLKKEKLQPHDEMMKEFKDFPEKYRNAVPNFAKLPLEKKKEELDILKVKIEEDFKEKMGKAEKFFSEAEIKQATKSFKEATVGGPFGKAKALEMLDNHIKVCETKVKEFEDLIKELPEKDAADAQKLQEEFKKARFDGHRGKEEMVDELKTQIEAKKQKLTEDYTKKISLHVDQKNIRESSAVEYLAWFEQKCQTLKEKQTAWDKLDDEMSPRKAVTDRFKKELDPKIQQHPRAKEFFDLSRESREARLNELLDLQKSMGLKKPEVAPTANLDLSTEGIQQIKQRAENVNDSSLEKMSDEQLLALIEKGKNAQALMDARTLTTILGDLTDAANKNSKLNGNVATAESRTKGFSNEEQELADQIAEESAKMGKKKTLKRNRISGETEVADVIRLDAKRLQSKSTEEINRLKKSATKLQRGGDQEALVTNQVEIINDGKVMSTEFGVNEAQRQQEELANKMSEKVATDLKAKGLNLNDQDRARLTKLSKKVDTSVRLEADQEAA